MSYSNLLRSTLGAKPCGCVVGWSHTVGAVAILGHIAECPEARQNPRKYTWTSGGETRTGDLAALVADRDAWLPGLFTGGVRDVKVLADDGERWLRAAPFDRFGLDTPGWRVMVDDERVDVPDPS